MVPSPQTATLSPLAYKAVDILVNRAWDLSDHDAIASCLSAYGVRPFDVFDEMEAILTEARRRLDTSINNN